MKVSLIILSALFCQITAAKEFNAFPDPALNPADQKLISKAIGKLRKLKNKLEKTELQ